MSDTATTEAPAPTQESPDWAWALPGHRPTPAEALPRIAALCQAWSDPFMAMFCVLATHNSLPREVLAAAVLQYRPDLADLSRDDVAGLMTSIVNGGRQGYDAVLRSRRKGDRKSAAAMWMSKD